MIEGVLRGLTDLEGVQVVLLVERDGFVVHAQPSRFEIDSAVIESWNALAQKVPNEALSTVVMESGYLILKPVEKRVLMTVCERSCNLGNVRQALQNLKWPS
jgi:predicted regulator of Ras-like GTPase activity (Roadblock/LC7/MglB family)